MSFSRFLIRWPWVPLTAALVLGLMVLVLHRPGASTSANELGLSVPQVLAGYHAHPSAWAGRTVTIRATWLFAYEKDAPAIPLVPDDPHGGVPYTVFYDAPSQTFLPEWGNITNAMGENQVESLYRITLAAWPACGPLGLGQHPCLVAIRPVYLGETPLGRTQHPLLGDWPAGGYLPHSKR